jgi:hypothetical protein
MPAYVPTEPEKIELFTRHFYYEVQILAEATALHYSLEYSLPNSAPATKRAINNMCLETTMHARVLLQFFTSQRRSWDKDAIPSDFLKVGEAWTIPTINEVTYPNLKKVKDRASKEVAHLTYERVPADQLQTSWDLAGIVIEMFDLINKFVPKCKEDYVSNELKQLIGHLADFVNKLKADKASGRIP